MKNKVMIFLPVAVLIGFYIFNTTKHIEPTNKGVLNENIQVEKKNQQNLTQSEQVTNQPTQVNEEVAGFSSEPNPEQIIERPASAHFDPAMQKVCERGYQEHSCIVDTTKNLEALLFNEAANAVNLKETVAVIESKNFDDVMNSVTGNLSEFITKSEEYNLKANNLITAIAGVEEANIGCGKVMCAAEITYTDDQGWKLFETSFFDQNNEIGNIVSMPVNKTETQGYSQMRVIFFLGQGMSTSLGSSR